MTAVAILFFASMIGLGSNAIRSDSLPLVYREPSPSLSGKNGDLPGSLAMVDLASMSEMYRKEGVVVLDARDLDFYLLERIPERGACL